MKTRFSLRGLLALTLLLAAQWLQAQNIKVVFNGNKASVNIPTEVTDVTADIDGAYVTITSTTAATEYTYTVQGSTNNGALTLNGAYKLTLELNGANIRSQRGAAIDVECGKRIAVVVAEGTTNTLADMAGGTQKAAMYFTGHPEFEGAGTLNVTGNTKHAISAKEYVQFKKSFGTLNVLGAVSDGIHCGREKVAAWDEEMVLNEKEFFRCNGGNINISNCGGDCIDAGAYGCILIKGGALNLTVSAFDVCAMKSPNTFIMEDGQINIDITGDCSDGIYINNQARFLGGELNIDVQGNGAKGIKGKLKASSGYTEGGNIRIDGTRMDIVARGADDLTDPEDPSHCVAISVDGNLQCSGEVNVTAVGDARGVTCDGTLTGAANEKHQHWYAHPYDYQYDMTAYATLSVNGKKVTPDNVELAAFVAGECRGVAEAIAGTTGVYYIRIRSNSTSSDAVSFKAYANGEELDVECATAVHFESQKVWGTATAPLALTAGDEGQGGGNDDTWEAPVPASVDEIISGEEYYIYNIGAAQFLTYGNAWGTQISVDSRGSNYLLEYVEGDEEHTGWTIYNNDPSFDKGADRRYMFLEGDNGFNDMNGQGHNFFDFQPLGNGEWLILPAKGDLEYGEWARDDEYYNMSLGLWTVENGFTSIVYNNVYDEDGNAVRWSFVTTEAYEIWQQRSILYEFVNEAAEYGIDTAPYVAVYNDKNSTVEELEAAAEEVKAKLAIAILQDATEDNPVDATRLMVNPDFETGNIQGWDCTFVSGVTGTNVGYQGDAHGGDVRISRFIEAWANSSFNPNFGSRALGDAQLSQTIKGLPKGKYCLSVDIIATNGDGYEVKGVELFATGGSADTYVSMATEGNAPEHFDFIFSHTGGDVTIGLRTHNTTANWIAADNFQLWYYGSTAEVDQNKIALDNAIKTYTTRWPDIDAVRANAIVKEDWVAALTAAENAKNNYPAITEALHAAAAQLQASIDDYKVLEAAIDLADYKYEEIYWQDISLDLTYLLLDEREALYDAYEQGTYNSKQCRQAANHLHEILAQFVQDNMPSNSDISFLLTNPNFDYDTFGWNTTGGGIEWGGMNLENTAGTGMPLGEIGSGCVERYHNAFGASQTIKMPAGEYTITCNGFERDDNGNGVDAVFYAIIDGQETSVPLWNLRDDGCDELLYQHEGSTWDTSLPEGPDGKYVPNTMCGSNVFFAHGYYQNTLTFTLESPAYVTIGVKTDSYSDWVLFDNFKITYKKFVRPNDVGTLYSDGAECHHGETVVLPISMDSTSPVSGFQFNITIPDGLTLQGNKLTDRAPGFALSRNLKDGKYHYAALSLEGEVIAPGDGALLNLTLGVDDAAEGEYTVLVSDVMLFMEDGTEVPASDVEAKVNVLAYMLGDVNNNGVINTNDAIAIVNHVIGKPQSVFIREAADVNGNGTINTNDAIAIINYVVGKTSSLKVKAAPMVNDDCIMLNASEGRVSVSLCNAARYQGFQCEVQVPAGVKVDDIVLNYNRTNGHMLFVNRIAEGRYAIASLSLGGDTFSGNDGELFAISTSGRGEVVVDNVLFFTDRGQEVSMTRPEATAVNGIEAAPLQQGEAYDLSGRKTTATKRGVYIVSGRKQVVR